MARTAGSKLKLLYLAKILQEQSDEEHPMTVQQIIVALSVYNIKAERKSVYDDIEALQQFGYEIIIEKSKSNSYYMGERNFQMPELKLLVDSVQASRFITEKKSRELIRKISSFASRHQANQLQRQVHGQGQSKTVNEGIYYNVDAIHSAILANKMIRYQYFEWAVSPASPKLFAQQWRKDGAFYAVSPWSMLWDDENYYLIAYDAEAKIIKHYRVDKMARIEITDQPRDGRPVFEELDISSYTKRTFGMFGGEESTVKLRFSNRLIGVVVDRFGNDSMIQLSGNCHFTITIKAVISPQFFSWLLGFGNEVEVLEPTSLIAQLKEHLESVTALYSKG